MNKNKNIFDHRNCLSKEELISYAKGTLSEKEKHFVEKHLLDCELCTEALEGILALSDASKLHNISREMIHRLSADRPFTKKNKIRPAYFAAAAVICVFIISGIYFAFIRNPEELKSEMAVLPFKKEEVKPAPSSPAANNSIEKSNETVAVSSDAEIKQDTTTEAQPRLQEVQQQNTIAATETGISQKDNDVSIIQPPSDMYNGTLAAAEKAKEETPVLAEKKSVPAQDEAKTSGYKSIVTDSLRTVPSGNYPAQKNTEAVSMNARTLEKSMSNDRQANMDDELKDVKKKMEVENFKDALKELKQLSKEYPHDMNVIYYTGLVYYKTNETAKALESFDRVLNSGDKKLFEDARLYKALTYVKMNDKLNARKILSHIIAEKGIYKERADGILEQMDGN
ncbi:MAG TPA: zf-HC2 domain-containing protein [Bacteroidia bacterium]|nr:zf-HC2 domain-containing protein [Bacteroidia bacterium]